MVKVEVLIPFIYVKVNGSRSEMYLKGKKTFAIFRQNTGKNILTYCAQNDDVIISHMSKASAQEYEKSFF